MSDQDWQINPYEDVIDSRAIIDRIEELEGAEGDLTESEAEELVALRDLATEASDYADDWQHGVTLIRDTYFTEYAQELAEDMGAIPEEHSWPTSCIDWDRAADDLKMDYTSVSFNGHDYWVGN